MFIVLVQIYFTLIGEKKSYCCLCGNAVALFQVSFVVDTY
jgi:hypothetical protein